MEVIQKHASKNNFGIDRRLYWTVSYTNIICDRTGEDYIDAKYYSNSNQKRELPWSIIVIIIGEARSTQGQQDIFITFFKRFPLDY